MVPGRKVDFRQAKASMGDMWLTEESAPEIRDGSEKSSVVTG